MRLSTVLPILLVSVSAAFFSFPSIVSASTASDQYNRISAACQAQGGKSCTGADVQYFNAATLACRNPSQSQCTDLDRAFLQGVRPKIESSGTGIPVTPATGTPAPASGTCSSWLTDFSFDACLVKPVLTFFGSLFLMFGAFILRLVGQLFEALVQAVIVDFGGTLTAMKLGDAIATGWTIFRDFANILIIGMFVFIAICIILGIKEYGQKKLIANVLIVAMLLNFSLLFTRLVIDVSNYTASQIYTAMAGPSGSGTANIAEGFLKSMGITTIWDDSGKVVAAMANEKNVGGSFKAFAFGLMGGLMLLTVALVLLYGCLIIAARGLLFVFLMLTAAIAFATYLIPGMAQGEYGFSKWWKTLLNAAIFAPLLMIFLAISLVIVRRASDATATAGGNTGPIPLGTLVSDPTTLTSSGGWMTILLFALATGLLFLSIRLSSKFAGSISGMGYVPGLFRNLAAAPFALTAGRIVAPLMQRTIGRSAFARAGSLTGAARAANLDSGLATNAANRYAADAARLARAGNLPGSFNAAQSAAAQRQLALDKQSEAKSLLEKAAKAKITADKTFNAMDSGIAKAINKAVGNAMTGESEKGAKGYASRVEEQGKAAAKLADEAKLSDSQKREIEESARNERAGDLENRRALHQAAQANLESAQASRQAAKNQSDIAKSAAELEQNNNRSFIEAARNLAAAASAKNDKSREHSDAVDQLMARINETADPGAKQNLRDMLTQLRANQTNEMQAFDQRIDAARAEQNSVVEELAQSATGRQARAAEIALREAETTLAAAETSFRSETRQLTNLRREIDTSVRNKINEYDAAARGATENVAASIGYKTGGQHVADAARSALKSQRGGAERLKKLLRDQEITGGDNPSGGETQQT